jgi:hypothetical protein
MMIAAIMAMAVTVDASNEGFETFSSFCLMTRGDGVAAVSAADKSGWEPVTDQELRQFGGAPAEPNTYQMRTHAIPEGSMTLTVNRSTKVIDEVSVRISRCQLGFAPADFDTVAALAKAWAAVPPSAMNPADEGAMFMFADDHGRHIALADADVDRLMPVLLREHDVMQLAVYNRSRGSALRLTVYSSR